MNGPDLQQYMQVPVPRNSQMNGTAQNSPKMAQSNVHNPHSKLKISNSKPSKREDTNIGLQGSNEIHHSIISPPMFEILTSGDELSKMKNFLDLEEEDKNFANSNRKEVDNYGVDEEGRMAAEDENVCVFIDNPQANLMCPIHKGNNNNFKN